MSRPAARLVILVCLLAAAVVAAVWLQRRPGNPSPFAGAGYALVTDLDTWRATRRERQVWALYDLRPEADFSQVPLELGDWTGRDIPQDNLEVFLLLQPDQYLFRQYRRGDGTLLWLSLVAGREARSFHPPQICYTADGWRTEMESVEVGLAQGELWGMHMLARKEGMRHSVLYFYLWPDRQRDPAAGTVLFKVTAPLGSEGPGEVDAVLEDQKAFVRELFLRGASP